MAAVTDASPLILFARTGYLYLLPQLFEEVRIPPRVAHEVLGHDVGRPGARETADAVGTWLTVVTPQDNASVADLRLLVDAGEAEAIVLAQELALLLVVDDLGARSAARRRRVPVTGTAGVLGVAKREGRIALVRPVLDTFIQHGLRLSRGLYAQILNDAGESTA